LRKKITINARQSFLAEYRGDFQNDQSGGIPAAYQFVRIYDQMKRPSGLGLGYRALRLFIVATALTPDAHNEAIIREKQHDKQAK
jgi:hypothetical protein